MDDEEHAYVAISRAQEILAADPIETDAELEVRRRRNALERIMSPPVPPPPQADVVIRRENHNALTEASQAAIRRKALDAQGALSDDETRERWGHRCIELQAMARRNPSGAIAGLAVEVAALAIAVARSRDKPRYRVPAGSRRL
jgi:hypothetical protein